jgi:hypothetical protein
MLFALFAAQTFFLWMFFVAGGLERLAELGQVVGPQGVNVRSTVFDFAARWRHGMTADWPLYMPGFFVTAIVLWRRAIGLSLRPIVVECAVTGMLAIVIAWLLSIASARLILDAFHAQTDLRVVGIWPVITIRVIGQGLFTLISWNSFVLASQFAIIHKSFKPLLIPAALSIVLVLIRPFTVGDFTSLWVQRSFEGDGVAIFSALLIPFLSVLLAWILIKRDYGTNGKY